MPPASRNAALTRTRARRSRTRATARCRRPSDARVQSGRLDQLACRSRVIVRRISAMANPAWPRDVERMTPFICKACGTHFAETESPPNKCKICEDERQYVPPSGQEWTTLEQMRARHRNSFAQCEPGLFGIGTVPEFAIGQRALLLRTEDGNFLWDCISLIDDATIELIRALGGLRGISISHPHYYSSMVEWSRAFNGAP